MNLHVIAYPDLATADYEMIQACRKEYNSLFNIIAPHFTIVFSVPDMPEADFIAEVKKQTAHTPAIHFCLRCSVVNKDAFSNNYDAFLVPDEGFSSIVKFHDKLYSDKLSHHYLPDISYIPHISIANAPDVQVIQKIVARWNEKDFAIQGTISALDIINYENRVITTIERLPLQG